MFGALSLSSKSLEPRMWDSDVSLKQTCSAGDGMPCPESSVPRLASSNEVWPAWKIRTFGFRERAKWHGAVGRVFEGRSTDPYAEGCETKTFN